MRRLHPLLVLALLAGCRIETAAPQSSGPISASSNPSGEVWVYTSMYRHVLDAFDPLLKKALPEVHVNWVQAGSEKIASRLEAELAAGGTQADLLLTSDPFLYARYKEEGRWLRYASPNGLRTPRTLVDLDGHFAAARLSTMVMVYREGETAPASFAALGEPEWKDAVALGDPLTSGTAFTWAVFEWAARGSDCFERLRANGAQVAGGNAAVLQKVEGREAKVGVVLLENVLAAQARGSKVAVAWPSDGAVLVPGPVAILKSSRNPVAAKAVLDVLLSPEGQVLIAEKGEMHAVDPRVVGPHGQPGLDALMPRTQPWSEALLARGLKDGPAIKAAFARAFSALMKRALAIVAVLVPLGLFALWPLVALLYRTLGGQLGTLGVVAESESTEALWATLRTSLGAAAFAFSLGFPLALLIARTDVPGRTALRALWILPSAIPPFIQGMGWRTLANPSAGLLNLVLGANAVDIYGELGIAFVLGIAAAPMVMLAAEATLARLDPALEESARVFGAGPLRALVAVSGLLSLPAALAGATLAFLFSASAFGVPYLLGRPARPAVKTLTVRIYEEVLQGPLGLARAAALSLSLLVLAGVVLVASERLGRRSRVALGAGKGVARRQLQLGRWRAPLAVLAWASAVGLVVLPLSAVALTSVMPSYGRLDGLTFKHWSAVLGSAETLDASARSLWLSLVAAALVAGLGLVLAVAQKRLGRAGRAAALLAAWPYAVPGTVLALGLLVAFSRDLRFVFFDQVAFVLALANTGWMLLVAWTVKHLAFGVRNASEGLARVDVSLGESARVFGAAPGRAFFDATLPQLRAPLAAAFTLTFLTCITELTLAVLLKPSGKDTLGTLLFELQSYSDPAAAAVIACAFVGLVLATLSALALVRRQEAH